MAVDEQRVARLEIEMRELTENVTRLAASTEQLAKGWGETQQVMKQQVEHATTIGHFRVELDRAFKQIAGLRGELQGLRELLASLNTRLEVVQAVDKVRVGFLEFLMRYWHVVSLIGAASAFAGYNAK
jgi:chromosome segregation ATPase